MRKIIISLVILAGFSVSGAAFAQTPPVLAEDAPDRHVVVPGDTLWGISGRFLKQPWRWPELWQLNKEQIRNPHLIYPGDVVVLDRSGPSLRLLNERAVRLQPAVRAEMLETQRAVPSIPASAIEPFLSRPMVIDRSTIEAAPRIIAMQENRVVIGAGNIAYAKGLPKDKGDAWQVFRPGTEVRDPETGDALGFESVYLGEARVIRTGEIDTLQIVRASQEIQIGDRLFASPKNQFGSYVPSSPEKTVKGVIVSAYGNSIKEVGPNAMVTLNRGTRDGLAVGNVLAIHRSAQSSRDVFRNEPMYGREGLFTLKRESTGAAEPLSGVRNTPLWGRSGPTGSDPTIKPTEPATVLPDERYGLLFVFRTFERMSYALVLQASRPVNILDIVQNP
jgi:LysM repeat protein